MRFTIKAAAAKGNRVEAPVKIGQSHWGRVELRWMWSVRAKREASAAFENLSHNPSALSRASAICCDQTYDGSLVRGGTLYLCIWSLGIMGIITLLTGSAATSRLYARNQKHKFTLAGVSIFTPIWRPLDFCAGLPCASLLGQRGFHRQSLTFTVTQTTLEKAHTIQRVCYLAKPKQMRVNVLSFCRNSKAVFRFRNIRMFIWT